MKPKKDTKIVHTKNTRDTKNTRRLLYKPPAAMRLIQGICVISYYYGYQNRNHLAAGGLYWK